MLYPFLNTMFVILKYYYKYWCFGIMFCDSDEEDVEKVQKISFGILSTDEVRSISKCEVITHETYANNLPISGGLFDLRMGTLDSKLLCETDQLDKVKNPGFFGKIELNHPIFNVLFFPYVQKILKCVCHKCGTCYSIDSCGLQDSIEKSKRVKHCPNCNTPKFDKIVKTDLCKVSGVNKDRTTFEFTPEYVLELFKCDSHLLQNGIIINHYKMARWRLTFS